MHSPTGKLLAAWTAVGSAPGEFKRPAGLALDAQGDLYVVDGQNHRIQVLPAGQFSASLGPTPTPGPTDSALVRQALLHFLTTWDRALATNDQSQLYSVATNPLLTTLLLQLASHREAGIQWIVTDTQPPRIGPVRIAPNTGSLTADLTVHRYLKFEVRNTITGQSVIDGSRSGAKAERYTFTINGQTAGWLAYQQSS